jgi:hypothetical protein
MRVKQFNHKIKKLHTAYALRLIPLYSRLAFYHLA